MSEETQETKTNRQGFVTTMNKGFQLTFKNNWTISVQWGRGNYCHHGYTGEYGGEQQKPSHYSPDCEIAIWYTNTNGEVKDYDFGYDTVKGYCDPEEVADWIYKVSNWS